MQSESPARDPVEALRQIAYALEAAAQPGFRSRAFMRAATTIASLPPDRVRALAEASELQTLPNIGAVMERTILEALAGKPSAYLERLEEITEGGLSAGARRLLESLRGDCHVHSDWSDGGAAIEDMAAAAIALGREYMVLTDHSPRLTIAHGLSPERLRQQLDVVEALNRQLAPFRILSGIECDILEDGGLDQEPELLARLDVVVGSVHSKLRQDAEGMTARMLAAIANPHLDILGHCTGRIVVGKGRPESNFDAEAVFQVCARYDKAVEINCRPERVDPPDRLLRLAEQTGCRFAIDTDAHAPGQLTWLRLGAARADLLGVPSQRIVNTMASEALCAWAASHEAAM